MNTGFIGLGIMGRPMALNLLKKRRGLRVFDISPEAVKTLVEAGAVSASLKKIGAECSVIFLILPNGEVVKEALFGDGGLSSKMQPGTIVVDMSSVTAAETVYCADRLKKMEVDFIDAPVSGGEPKAIDATLAFMAGGDASVFEKIRPVLLEMGGSALLVGKTGSGSITKLANQMIVNLNIAAVSEALVFAAKAGVNPELVHQAIRGGLAASAVLDAKAPLMYERDFKPGGKIAVNHKDIKNALATAREIDAPAPFSAQLFEIMQTLKVKGHFNDDHSGIVQYFENLADCRVKK